MQRNGAETHGMKVKGKKEKERIEDDKLEPCHFQDHSHILSSRDKIILHPILFSVERQQSPYSVFQILHPTHLPDVSLYLSVPGTNHQQLCSTPLHPTPFQHKHNDGQTTRIYRTLRYLPLPCLTYLRSSFWSIFYQYILGSSRMFCLCPPTCPHAIANPYM